MKKTIFIFTVFILIMLYGKVYAQNWNDYFLLRTGYIIPDPQNLNGKMALQVEYGKTYKWLNVGISLDYKNSFFDKYEYGGIVVYNDIPLARLLVGDSINETSTGLSLHASIDCIRIFLKNSKHSLRIGAKIGKVHSLVIKQEQTTNTQVLRYISNYGTYAAFDITYDYALNKNTHLGLFYESTVLRPCYGLTLCRKF